MNSNTLKLLRIINDTVANVCNIDPREMVSQCKTREVAEARFIALNIIMDQKPVTLPMIEVARFYQHGNGWIRTAQERFQELKAIDFDYSTKASNARKAVELKLKVSNF